MKKKAVLIVDDDESTRFVLARALEGLGHQVTAADDGADVPDLIAAYCFDLLVVDLYMPGMNGFEILRRIRRPDPGFLPAPRTPPSVPVLVVSGENHPASIANALALGADEYLTKPVDLDLLNRVVEQLLYGPRPSSSTQGSDGGIRSALWGEATGSAIVRPRLGPARVRGGARKGLDGGGHR